MQEKHLRRTYKNSDNADGIGAVRSFYLMQLVPLYRDQPTAYILNCVSAAVSSQRQDRSLYNGSMDHASER